MDSSKIRIAVLNSNPNSRKHLVNLLGKEDDLEVVTEVGSDIGGIRLVEGHKPDVILVAGKEPFTDRIENTSLVVAKFPNTKVIVLSIDQRRTTLPHHSTHPTTASSCQTWACYSLCVNYRSNGATDDRRNGASWKYPKSNFGRLSKL